MQQDWVLSHSFVSDSQGFRAACILPPGAGDGAAADAAADEYQIVAGNQGGGLFQFGVPSRSFHPIQYQHNHSVTALLASTDGRSYITGCKDGIIRVFDAATHQLSNELKGHEKPVTSLCWATSTHLVSGSWDGTAKVWNIETGAMVATLSGHENSVCVAALPSPNGNSTEIRIATGSAGVAQNNRISDHQVRLWTVNTATGKVACKHRVANDHDGPIRDIACMMMQQDSATLMTCSNDGTIKLRSVQDASCVTTLAFVQQVQHPPMMLSVVPLAGPSAGGIVSSAEDGHVVVWDQLEGGEPTVIKHPACVWNAVALPNGDFATCCQDGTLRIFTKATDRMATQEEREAFQQLVQEASQKLQSGPTPDEIAKLPLWENSFQQRGTSEGQVQIFNKGGVAIAAQWSMASQTWIEVGQVMGSSDQGMVDGVQYDHVLPIEVDQTGGGVAKLQLGYNNGENPFVAAQRFVDTYMLPQYHLNDIANYIQQRVGSQPPTLGAAGAGAGGGGGGGTFSPGQTIDLASAPPSAPKYTHIPVKGYLAFELPASNPSKSLDKMKGKIVEFGHLNESQVATLESLISTLGVTNRYHASSISRQELAIIQHMLDTFPPEQAFPALDLARLTVCHPNAAASGNLDIWKRILTRAIELSKVEGLDGVPAVALPMLTLRLFANCFKGGPGSLQAVAAFQGNAIDCAQRFVASSNKNIRLSVATLLYNISFYAQSNAISSSTINLIPVMKHILESAIYEAEAKQRCLLALGSIVLASDDVKQKAVGITIADAASNPVAKEVQDALSQ